MFFQQGKLQNRERAVITLLISLCFVYSAHAQTKLLRFPDIHDDKVAFTYGGDLWLYQQALRQGVTALREAAAGDGAVGRGL